MIVITGEGTMNIKTIAGIALAGAILTSQASAETKKYDTRIEEAVKRIVAEKIGEIRSGFAIGEKPVFFSAELVMRQEAQRRISLGRFQWAKFDADRK